MEQAERLAWLIDYLVDEDPRLAAARRRGELSVPAAEDERFRLYRSLVNVRPPRAVEASYLEVEDGLLQGRRDARPIATLDDAEKVGGELVWQGDITTLAVDAIVNAANSRMLGCFSPCHGCIDNAIHTAAGVRLRLACNEHMLARAERLGERAPLLRSGRKDGIEFPTGEAMATPGFNLPAGHVIHTVGPIVGGTAPTARNRADLAGCYRSCLDIAIERGFSSLAFCCISTGVFRFPNREAARIAIDTIRSRRAEARAAGVPFPTVVFNVFTDGDLGIYRDLLLR